MTFSKWQAFGNVYLLAEPADERLSPDGVRELCARSADGVLEVLAVEGNAAEIVIWNADGSTAELSGNGTRIAAAWLAERTGARDVGIRVGGREVAAHVRDDGSIEQDLGPVEVGPPEVIAGVPLRRVSVGNPHAVVLGDPATIGEVGPLLESNPAFPNRTNVQVARVERPGVVTARVWERGVGETPSSGTSAVAVAAATQGDGDVVVSFPGGDLLVRLAGGRASLVGTAERLPEVS
jgi:diaminopimelate epimerase